MEALVVVVVIVVDIGLLQGPSRRYARRVSGAPEDPTEFSLKTLQRQEQDVTDRQETPHPQVQPEREDPMQEPSLGDAMDTEDTEADEPFFADSHEELEAPFSTPKTDPRRRKPVELGRTDHRRRSSVQAVTRRRLRIPTGVQEGFGAIVRHKWFKPGATLVCVYILGILTAVALRGEREETIPMAPLQRYFAALDAGDLGAAEQAFTLFGASLPDEVFEGLRDSLENERDEKTRSMRRKAKRAFRNKNYSQAIEEGLAVLELSPHKETLFIVAEAYRFTGQLDEAETFYKKYADDAEIDRKTDDALFWRAEVLRRLGRADEAKTLFKRVVGMQNSNFKTSASRRLADM